MIKSIKEEGPVIWFEFGSVVPTQNVTTETEQLELKGLLGKFKQSRTIHLENKVKLLGEGGIDGSPIGEPMA